MNEFAAFILWVRCCYANKFTLASIVQFWIAGGLSVGFYIDPSLFGMEGALREVVRIYMCMFVLAALYCFVVSGAGIRTLKAYNVYMFLHHLSPRRAELLHRNVQLGYCVTVGFDLARSDLKCEEQFGTA